MTIKDDPRREGHTREWADRARVETDPREDVKRNASPKQSPVEEDVEEQSTHLQDDDKEETVY